MSVLITVPCPPLATLWTSRQAGDISNTWVMLAVTSFAVLAVKMSVLEEDFLDASHTAAVLSEGDRLHRGL